MNDDIEFKLSDSCYKIRVARTDGMNLAIQRLSGRTWKTLQYHGSSLHSLCHGLKGLITDNIQPDPDDSLAQQLDRILADVNQLGQEILAALEGIDGPG